MYYPCEYLRSCAKEVVKYCEFIGIDLDFFIRTKMKYNRLRGYKHGGKRY